MPPATISCACLRWNGVMIDQRRSGLRGKAMWNGQRDYIKEYDEAPEDKKYYLVRGWMKSEPLPFFKQLREQRPILVTSECTLVTLFSDVTDVMLMPRV